MEELSQKELEYLFHSCGYALNPKWFDDQGGYRNFFCIANTDDDPTIKNLVEKGLMYLGLTEGPMLYYLVTETAEQMVRKLWEEKKAKAKPASIRRRRLEAYLWNKENFNGYRDFLRCLKINCEETGYIKKTFDI